MRVEAVCARTDYNCVLLSEFRFKLCEALYLGRAYEGKVSGVKEEDDPLPFEVR
jgi:hypothetical protein